MNLAYKRVKANKGAGGIDDVEVDAKMVKSELFYHGLKKAEAPGFVCQPELPSFFIR